MPDWQYISHNCNGGQIQETWRVYCGEGETVCKDLGCHAVLESLASVSPAGGPKHGDKANPGLSGFVAGVGYPYVNRPCDCDAPGLFLEFPDVGDVSEVGNRCCREVTLTWKPLDGETEGPTDSDEQEVDSWCPQLNSNSVERIEAAVQMKFGGIWQAKETANDNCCTTPGATDLMDMQLCDGRTIKKGDCATPQASNGQPYDPPLEIRKSDRSYSIKFFRACSLSNPFDESVFDDFDKGVINCSQICLQINCRCWKRTFAPRTLLISAIRTDGQELKITNPLTGAVSRVPYMCVTFDLVHRSEGWQSDILNAGTQICGVSGGGSSADNQVLTDSNGYSVDHLTPLSKPGLLLPKSEREWYTRWEPCCADFSDVPVLKNYICA